MPNPMIDQARQNIEKLKPEQRQKMQRFLTPQFALVAGTLFGDEVGAFLKSISNSTMQSVPVPIRAMRFLGDDKFNKFIQKAVEDAALIEQEQMAAQPQQGGFAAPTQQVQQQAPVSPPAPTGFSSRPQLPLPTTSNALSIDNQPIQ